MASVSKLEAAVDKTVSGKTIQTRFFKQKFPSEWKVDQGPLK